MEAICNFFLISTNIQIMILQTKFLKNRIINSNFLLLGRGEGSYACEHFQFYPNFQLKYIKIFSKKFPLELDDKRRF